MDSLLNDLNVRTLAPEVLPKPLPLTALPTPALLVDEGALERNIQFMASHLQAAGKGARPHFKTHKCPEIARRQMAAGAVGLCAAKFSEAWILARAGIRDVLITSPVIGPERWRLLPELLDRCPDLKVVVDDVEVLEGMAAAVAGGQCLGVVVDLDVAMGRTGTRSVDRALRLASRAAEHSGLRFAGIQHYAGHLMHLAGHSARAEASRLAWDQALVCRTRLAEIGLAPEIVTGGGTGTYDIDSAIDELTDLQVGSYVFMDEEYAAIGSEAGERFEDFEVALTLLATVISGPLLPHAVTVDSGTKVMASDTSPPRLLGQAAAAFRFAGDEHGVLITEDGTEPPALGEVVRFVTPHCDPTVNLHDWLWVVQDEAVVARWPVAARGCSW